MNTPIAQIGAALVVVAGALGFGACGSDDNSDTVDVSLREYSVGVSPKSMKAGNIKLEAKNTGGATHEMVVVRAPDAESLPTAADGSVDEDKIAESDAIGEIEDIEDGKTVSKSFDLSPGTYVVFCNVVEGTGASAVSHFHKGMHTTLTITPK